MDELPEYSPFIQSEIIYRKIIINLTYESKISFLYLQLNSGGGNDYVSLNTFYKIKMIPLIKIQKHLIEDFIPFFFTFQGYKALAFNIPQTLIKSFNEKKIQISNEIVALHESNLNTAKILMLKFHENSHSKYRGNNKMEKSPRFVFKNNLSILDNDYNKIKMKLKNYFSNIENYREEEEEEENEDREEEEEEEEKEEEEEEEKEKKEEEEDEDEYEEEDEDEDEDEKGDEEINKKWEESNYGESGFAFEFYLFNDYYFSNAIALYRGKLDELLDHQLYIQNNFNKLKKIIKRKIKMELIYNKEDIIKELLDFSDFKKKSKINIKKIGKLPTYQELGFTVLE